MAYNNDITGNAATATIAAAYLPLAGGAMAGTVTFSSSLSTASNGLRFTGVSGNNIVEIPTTSDAFEIDDALYDYFQINSDVNRPVDFLDVETMVNAPLGVINGVFYTSSNVDNAGGSLTASASGNTVTGVGTNFTSAVKGGFIYWPSTNTIARILTVNSTTSLTIDNSIAQPTAYYQIYRNGIYVSGEGFINYKNGIEVASVDTPLGGGTTLTIGAANANAVTVTPTTTFTNTIHGSINGNAATVTTIPTLSGDISNSGNVTTYNGIVPLAKGGAAASLAGGSTGQLLQRGASSVGYTSATLASTYNANDILVSLSANTVAGLAIGNSALLASNSSGTVAGRSFSIKTTVFSIAGGATQTFTPQTGSLYCWVRIVGGGGGSGGTAATSASQYAAATGGSGAEYAEGIFSTATILGAGTTAQINLGAAGAAGAAGANNGGAGGTTSVVANGGAGSTLLTAVGGGAGAGATAVTTGISFPGVAGGTSGTGGDKHTAGGASGGSIASVGGAFALSGGGGNSEFGSGGIAVTNAAGAVGSGAGAGASGASSYPSVAARAGALGIAGQVIITEYIIN